MSELGTSTYAVPVPDPRDGTRNTIPFPFPFLGWE